MPISGEALPAASLLRLPDIRRIRPPARGRESNTSRPVMSAHPARNSMGAVRGPPLWAHSRPDPRPVDLADRSCDRAEPLQAPASWRCSAWRGAEKNFSPVDTSRLHEHGAPSTPSASECPIISGPTARNNGRDRAWSRPLPVAVVRPQPCPAWKMTPPIRSKPRRICFAGLCALFFCQVSTLAGLAASPAKAWLTVWPVFSANDLRSAGLSLSEIP